MNPVLNGLALCREARLHSRLFLISALVIPSLETQESCLQGLVF